MARFMGLVEGARKDSWVMEDSAMAKRRSRKPTKAQVSGRKPVKAKPRGRKLTKAQIAKIRPTKARARKMVTEGAKKITPKDVDKVIKDADKIKRKFERQGPLRRYIGAFRLLISLVRDYFNGRYRKIPYWAIAAVTFALLYVLWPADLIPDFIPFVGLLDDAFVVAACIAMVDEDLDTYRAWKTKH